MNKTTIPDYCDETGEVYSQILKLIKKYGIKPVGKGGRTKSANLYLVEDLDTAVATFRAESGNNEELPKTVERCAHCKADLSKAKRGAGKFCGWCINDLLTNNNRRLNKMIATITNVFERMLTSAERMLLNVEFTKQRMGTTTELDDRALEIIDKLNGEQLAELRDALVSQLKAHEDPNKIPMLVLLSERMAV
jgi:hypothetical protein